MSIDKRFAHLGKVKRTTEEIMDDAIAKQSRIAALWNRNRPSTPAISNPNKTKPEIPMRETKKPESKPLSITPPTSREVPERKERVIVMGGGRRIKDYWFPILCASLVLVLLVWALIPGRDDSGVPTMTIGPDNIPVADARGAGAVPPTVSIVEGVVLPSFDIVRIERNGNIIVAGRYLPRQPVSIMMNRRIVATEKTNADGEFVFTPTKPLAPGNYTIRLSAVDQNIVSENDVFVYIPRDRNYARALSLLMTQGGSKILQAPALADGDLVVSKIDYLENGRIVVTGTAIPRLRVSLTLNGKYLGFARTSDHRHFMLGANTEMLEAGKRYTLIVRLHDGEGTSVAEVMHEFTMPKMTGNDDTYYTVRRGDALWIISRNFLGRGTMFTMIADANNIANPNVIFPKQRLRIPGGARTN
ncbi:MAG: LysM peptidoglycan-binding domain-containing protein [Alphaproteobacteria bacterium]|nr:LysM peptidoglycan-binding domain-containing protein [Alphaproteobacteria bacterium]MCL2758303.1 LysM peptidoglycan-binding domain-containing protein [Alphaproteobacteria bacterium]